MLLLLEGGWSFSFYYFSYSLLAATREASYAKCVRWAALSWVEPAKERPNWTGSRSKEREREREVNWMSTEPSAVSLRWAALLCTHARSSLIWFSIEKENNQNNITTTITTYSLIVRVVTNFGCRDDILKKGELANCKESNLKSKKKKKKKIKKQNKQNVQLEGRNDLNCRSILLTCCFWKRKGQGKKRRPLAAVLFVKADTWHREADSALHLQVGSSLIIFGLFSSTCRLFWFDRRRSPHPDRLCLVDSTDKRINQR